MDELASNHAKVDTRSIRSDRRLEASPERGCLAEESGGKKNEQDRDQVENVIEQEVGEYVITNEMKKHFITFFRFYADALNVPTADISLLF